MLSAPQLSVDSCVYRSMRLTQSRAVAVIAIALTSLSPGLYAKKKKPQAAVAVAPVPQMTPDQKALHALSRMTFGPRPGDVEAVKTLGVNGWIEQQLNPQEIAENPVLDAKLAPLDTLRMS